MSDELSMRNSEIQKVSKMQVGPDGSLKIKDLFSDKLPDADEFMKTKALSKIDAKRIKPL